MSSEKIDIQADVDLINSIPIIPQLLEVVCRTTGMGFSAVARVTDTKWVACSVRDEINFGLVAGGELKLETTICNEIRQSGDGVIIDYVAQDEYFKSHHTPAIYGFQSYISIPIVKKDGSFFGTLCAIDPKPNVLSRKEIVTMFKLFADLISFHLNSAEELADSNKKLIEEKETAELREQFIAILGHDLLNPVGAVMNVAQLMLRMPLEDRVLRLANIIQDASFRMRNLIDNMLDFARGRLGEGIILNRSDNEPVEKVLNEIIGELSIVWPDKVITTEFDLEAKVSCDGKRIGQLFSNLLGNAITHGTKDTPIIVKAQSTALEFTLSVTNNGEKIPDAAMARLFQPFSRGEIKPGQQGLGLGLFIASEIASAHGGSLKVNSTDEQTTFTLHIPFIPIQV